MVCLVPIEEEVLGMCGEWMEFNNLGRLEIEIVLVFFDYPIFFVCIDSAGKRYLTVCVDVEKDQYVLAEVSMLSIVEMLDNMKTMEQMYREAINNKILISEYDDSQDEYILQTMDATQLSALYLPEKGAMFSFHSKKTEEYKRELLQLIREEQ